MSRKLGLLLTVLFLLFVMNFVIGDDRIVVGAPPAPFSSSTDVGNVESLPAGAKWLTLPQVDFVVPPYGKYLKGKKICLDPGHGGDAAIPNYKVGPTGLREAEINLKIAKMLRDWLVECGAIVYMTRDGDYDLSKDGSEALALRSKVANDNQCDFFISMHHNASNRADANYPSYFYHDNPDYENSAIDLGRYICESLLDVQRMREPQSAGAYSDYLMFPGAGFGVLRGLTVPGILIEASFHSCPEEEARLKTDEYLKREAYAYLMGIARYAKSGFPTYEMVYPANGTMKPNETIQIKLIDDVKVAWGSKGSPRILKDTIKIYINNYEVPFKYDSETGIVSYTPSSPMQPGGYKILVKFINVSKNSALPKYTTIVVQP